MAQDEQSDQERCRVRLLRGGRKHGKERQRKYRRRTQGGETAQHEDIRRGGTRRRLHETGRRLRRSGSDGRGLARYPAYRSLPGGSLALLGVASQAAAELDQMGSQRRSEERRVGKEGRYRWAPYH